MSRFVVLLLIASSAAQAQTLLSFGQLNTLLLQLTPAQVTAIEANNAAYIQAQRTTGRRVYELNQQISAELRKEEPDAGVVNPAYQEIEGICRRRQPALSELIEKNLAVLNERQRTQVRALRYAYLRDRLAERAVWLLLASVQELLPPSPGSTQVTPLFSGTSFQGVGQEGDPRSSGVRELFEMIQTSEEQAEAILGRAREYERDVQEVWGRILDLSEELRKGLGGGGSEAGSQAIEIEKLRRQLAKRDAEVRQANRNTLSDAQRRRLSELLAGRSPFDTLLEMEAQMHFLLPADDASPDRPATVAAPVTQRDASQMPQPVLALRIYPAGSRLLEPFFGLRICVAGPEF